MSWAFIPRWRRRKCEAFDLAMNSTARRTVAVDLWGTRRQIYANANLSVYSRQPCNGTCGFCVERLRPAARGGSLLAQRTVEGDDGRYFAALTETLEALRPLSPSVSVTGGEPSKDPRLPALLRLLAHHAPRKLTVTTNGSGLMDEREGAAVVDWIVRAGVRHLNVSVPHPDAARSSQLMGLGAPMPMDALREVARRCRHSGTRLRLSCVLLREAVADLQGIDAYLDFARRLGVDNVIFRQLMKTGPGASRGDPVVGYCDTQRVPIEPLLEALSRDRRYELRRQIVGYYYYVEVWRVDGMDVVFEEADLAQLERAKRATPGLVHELVFHPNAALTSTWQPWDGVLGPKVRAGTVAA